MVIHKVSPLPARILGALVGGDQSCCESPRFNEAINSASITRSVDILDFMDQPTICREKRSSTVARYRERRLANEITLMALVTALSPNAFFSKAAYSVLTAPLSEVFQVQGDVPVAITPPLSS